MSAPEISYDIFANVLRQQATLRPNAVAHVFEGVETSFGLHNERANRVAQGLIAAGVKPDGRIGHMGKNTDTFFDMIEGAARAKAVTVGINWRLAPPEVAYVVNDSRSEVLFVTEDFYALVGSVLDQCPGVRQVIALDGGHPSWPSFEDWLGGYDAIDPMLEHLPDDDVMQLYTSGTTGHPKGVQLTNANFQSVVDQALGAGWADWDAGDNNLVCMPLFHIAGVNVGFLGNVYGCRNVILKDVDPRVILDLVETYEVNIFFMVPAVILLLTMQPDIRERNLSSIRSIIYGASPISDEVLTTAQDIFKCDFIQVYGLTETTGAGTSLSPADHHADPKLLRSCGKANPGMEIRIVGEDGEDVAQGEVGEICLKSGSIMKGYWNRSEATEEAIVDEWFHTGDAGFMDGDGYLYIHDRVKDMIVSGGENVYPAEVENALFSHADVADVAVIGVPDEKWGEAVKAIVVLKSGASPDPASIIAHARANIAGYKVPKSVDFADGLPRNPSGKILRRELRAPYWEGKERLVN